MYTLKPADMTATLYNTPEGSAYEDVTINTASLSVRDNVKGSDRVYGEDGSVYITVDTDFVDTTKTQKAITDVDGVYTGVQNVNLEVDTSVETIDTAKVEAQVYTVYDNDNYIIGAVVIGDVSGSGDYAYILSRRDQRGEDRRHLLLGVRRHPGRPDPDSDRQEQVPRGHRQDRGQPVRRAGAALRRRRVCGPRSGPRCC